MGRILECRNRGQVKLFETSTNGEHKVVVQAPNALTADVTVNMFAALGAETDIVTISTAGQLGIVAMGTPGQYLKVNGSGSGYEYGSVAASLQLAYDGGQTISTDGTNAVAISEADTSSSNTVLSVANSGSGYGIIVEKKSSGGNPALAVIKTNTGAGNVVQVTNDGIGIGINVNQNGNANGLYVGKSDTGSASAIAIENSSSGNAINVTQVGNAIALSVVKSGTGAGNVIQVTNSGTGAGINVDQNSNANGLSIGKSNTGSASVIAIRNSGSGPAVNIDQIGAGAGLAISNSNTGYGIIVEQKNTGANAGLYVSQSSSDNTVVLNKIGTSVGSVIDITNAGTGYDIDGNASNWHVDKDGNATFNSLTVTTPVLPKASSNKTALTTNSSTYVTLTDCTLLALPTGRKVLLDATVRATNNAATTDLYSKFFKIQRVSPTGTTDVVAETVISQIGDYADIATANFHARFEVQPYVDTTATSGDHTYRIVVRNSVSSSVVYVGTITAIECQ